MKYTSIDRIYTKLNRDLGLEGFSEVDVIEWAGEALEGINALRATEEAVAFLEVTNYQVEIPHNLHNVIQIAKNTLVDDTSTTTTSEEDETLTGEETNYPVCLDCNGTPYNDYEVAYYRPYFDLQYEYSAWMGNATYKRCYEPVRLTNHSFFNSIVCQEDSCDTLYSNSTYEYTIIEDKVFRFNFETGLVAVAYNRNVHDDDGIPMIPDQYSFISAITFYVNWKIQDRKYYLGDDKAEKRALKAEQKWQWYCKQASNHSLIPQGVDEMENLKDQWNYLIPRRNAYQNYFGNLNRREVKNIIGNQSRNNNYYGRTTG